MIHGGGLNGGTRKHEHIVSMAKYFASRGWGAFSLDYRLKADRGTVPNEWINFLIENPQIEANDFLKIYPANRDVKATIRWVYAMVDNYKINTNYITIGGGSAGAYLSITSAVTNDSDYKDEINVQQDPTFKYNILE